MRSRVLSSYSRPEDALACATLSAFCVAALPEGSTALGAVGQWASQGIHTAFGTVSWVVPAWLADAARRAYLGEPRDLKRTIGWAFYVLIGCVTFHLCRAHGGWLGSKVASMLEEMIGGGAYVIVCGIWIVAGLRLLGPHRVHQLACHASVLSCRALEQYRPTVRGLLLPTPDQTLHAEIVESCPDAVSVRIPELEPVRVQPVLPTAVSVPAKPRLPSEWTLPSTRLLQASAVHSIDRSYLAAVADHIARKLHSYGINASVAPAAVQGAIVHKLDLTPGSGQEINQITARQVDVEAMFKGLRFVQMPGTGRLGIEIPMPEEQRRTIAMRDVLESHAWVTSEAVLPIALGVTTAGEPVVIDIADCPHLLVAGTSGSGKSVGLNVMLTSLLLRCTPSELQLMLIDPKVVEFGAFSGIPHLISPVVTEIDGAAEAMQWALDEMERRYQIFAAARVKKISVYNTLPGIVPMPRIVVVVDEFADMLMADEGEVVEKNIARLAQKARAAGIHLIIATQYPTKDVITGRIKINLLSRIAYKVPEWTNSKVILDRKGAESLLGKGDSLCLMPSLSTDPIRVHGTYVDDAEVMAICDAWRIQATAGSETKPSPKPTQSRPVGASPKLPAVGAAQPANVVAIDEIDDCDEDFEASDAANGREPRTPAQSRIDDGGEYERAVAYAKANGIVSARQLMEELGCGHTRASRLFKRMKSDGLVQDDGPNNTHRYIGPN